MMAIVPSPVSIHEAIPVMAPPPIDFDWKHLILKIATSFGVDPIFLWIAGGLIFFFVLRMSTTKTFIDGHGELQKYTMIAVSVNSPRNSSGLHNTYVVYLLHGSLPEDVRKLCAQMLLVVGQSAKLLEYEDTWATTTNALVCCLLSEVLWYVFSLFSPSGGSSIFIVLALAWAPAGFLFYLNWRWEELRRRGVKLARKLDESALTLNVMKKK